jgi:hypothetical protein
VLTEPIPRALRREAIRRQSRTQSTSISCKTCTVNGYAIGDGGGRSTASTSQWPLPGSAARLHLLLLLGHVGDVIHLTDLAVHRSAEAPGTRTAVVEHQYGHRIRSSLHYGCTSNVCAQPVGSPTLSVTCRSRKRRGRGRADDVFGLCKVGQGACTRIMEKMSSPHF